jgi:hypothetical protein
MTQLSPPKELSGLTGANGSSVGVESKRSGRSGQGFSHQSHTYCRIGTLLVTSCCLCFPGVFATPSVSFPLLVCLEQFPCGKYRRLLQFYPMISTTLSLLAEGLLGWHSQQASVSFIQLKARKLMQSIVRCDKRPANCSG